MRVRVRRIHGLCMTNSGDFVEITESSPEGVGYCYIRGIDPANERRQNGERLQCNVIWKAGAQGFAQAHTFCRVLYLHKLNDRKWRWWWRGEGRAQRCTVNEVFV